MTIKENLASKLHCFCKFNNILNPIFITQKLQLSLNSVIFPHGGINEHVVLEEFLDELYHVVVKRMCYV